MNGFGFIEYEDAMDARDVVPGESSITKADSGLLTFATAFRMTFLSSSLSAGGIT